MSDYLWDKKGEPDKDVARLESLLGTFAHEPRPLEWPAETAEPEPPRATLLPFVSRARTTRLFAPAALAAAAALLVASLIAANAFLRARVPPRVERAAAQKSPQTHDADARKDERPAPSETQTVMLEPPPPASAGKAKDEKVEVETLKRVARRQKGMQLASVPSRRQKELNVEAASAGTSSSGLTPEAMNTRGVALSLVDNARLMTKEQLVYALRLTGAKLKDMRERAQKTEARP